MTTITEKKINLENQIEQLEATRKAALKSRDERTGSQISEVNRLKKGWVCENSIEVAEVAISFTESLKEDLTRVEWLEKQEEECRKGIDV